MTVMKSNSYRNALCGLVLLAFEWSVPAMAADCTLTPELSFQHDEIGTVEVFRDATTDAIAFASQMQVNTDGAPDSYHPDDIGITHICNGVSVGPDCTW